MKIPLIMGEHSCKEMLILRVVLQRNKSILKQHEVSCNDFMSFEKSIFV